MRFCISLDLGKIGYNFSYFDQIAIKPEVTNYSRQQRHVIFITKCIFSQEEKAVHSYILQEQCAGKLSEGKNFLVICLLKCLKVKPKVRLSIKRE